MVTPADSAARPARLLLHACCGPCLIEPLDALAAEADHVTICFSNSNIHPADEYRRRRDTLCDWAATLGVTVVELDYDPAQWARAVGPLAGDGPESCRACYALRLGEAARYAADNGYDAMATTLTVSPYQDAIAIAQEGARTAQAAGVRYVDRDFRPSYAQATRRSRASGMYRQNYCGCAYSEVEAAEERAARKAARAADRQRATVKAAEDEPEA